MICKLTLCPRFCKILCMTSDTIDFSRSEYPYGFVTPIESEVFPKGLNEDVVRAISEKKKEPPFLLSFRLKAFRKWQQMEEPQWANLKIAPINYQDISYYSEPKGKARLESLDQVDPEILKTFEKLGIPLDEQKRLANVAVDVVFDSISLGTTFRVNRTPPLREKAAVSGRAFPRPPRRQNQRWRPLLSGCGWLLSFSQQARSLPLSRSRSQPEKQGSSSHVQSPAPGSRRSHR